jgi:hypothetical protein
MAHLSDHVHWQVVCGIWDETEPYCAQVPQSVHTTWTEASDPHTGTYGKQNQNLLILKHCTLYISNEHSL